MPHYTSTTTGSGADPNRPTLPPDRAFVVQFSPDTDATHGCFAGRIEHVVSGRATRFSNAEELFRAIASQLDGGGT